VTMKRIFLTWLSLILILLLVLGLTARLGWWPVGATAVPPRWESKLAQAAFQASLSRQAAGLKDPLSPSNEVLTTGLKSFKTNCAGCHGSPGQPSQWGLETSIREFRNSPMTRCIYQRRRCS